MAARPRSRLATAAAALAMMSTVSAQDGALHVPSPDWRDQVIYFLMIDRFEDGDPANNDQGAGEYDPADRRRYSGGDLAGITRRLDYIAGLGATALWITPPVAHQWWDGEVGYGGYHGYWGEHFKEVDAHFGTLDDYRGLSRALHGRGMYLVQDIVVNHTGNFFGYPKRHDAARPTRGWRANPASKPVDAPRQWPFSLNDPRRAEHREAGIYHWTPDIRDFADPVQERSWQMSRLDDLATANPRVRQALRDSYGHWIREVGVDAFRVDTAFYVEQAFFDDFQHADDAQAPGVLKVAAATGREDFLLFGEGFGIDRVGEETQARKIETYATAPDGAPRLGGMINFPLYGSTLEVFARGRPTAELGDRIRRMMAVHRDPHRMPSFVDNHDVDRFLAGGSEAGLRQALLLILTLPGIPTIYYGTEQGFTSVRRAMFAGGYGADGRDHFDPQAPLYRYLREAIALRRAQPALSRGQPSVLHENAAGPGALAYRMDGEGAPLFVAFNSAAHPVLLDRLATGLAPGQRLEGLFAIEGEAPALDLDAEGRVSLVLPPHAGFVWRAAEGRGAVEPVLACLTLDIEPLADGRLRARGEAQGLDRIALVLDGDLSRAIEARPGRDGRWEVELDTRSLVDPAIEHRLVAWSQTLQAATEPATFRAAPRWTLLAEQRDPAGDDRGPRGRYRYPTDPSWGDNRQADLLGARAFGAGGSLRLELDLHRVTRSWQPANGFDHVAFGIYIALPGRDDGIAELPKQNASMPDGLRWQTRLRAHGWSNAVFSSAGAGVDAEGAPVSPGAAIEVDTERNRVSFLLPAAALGDPASLAGAAIYVTTWDYDGGWRGLQRRAGGHAFGGGDGAKDPLVMDDLLLRIPE